LFVLQGPEGRQGPSGPIGPAGQGVDQKCNDTALYMPKEALDTDLTIILMYCLISIGF